MSPTFEIGDYRGFPVVYVRGELDLASNADVAAVLGSLVERPQRCVLLDLLDVTYTESSALRAIRHAHRLMQQKSGVLAVVCCEDRVDKLAELAGLHDDLAVFHSIDLAVGFLSRAC